MLGVGDDGTCILCENEKVFISILTILSLINTEEMYKIKYNLKKLKTEGQVIIKCIWSDKGEINEIGVSM